MRQFTKEELEVLSNYESNFETAVNAGYKRATNSRQDQRVYDIYFDATGDTSLTKNWGCSYCSYTLYKKCGKKYFEDRLILNQLELEKENADNQEVKTNKKKKATNK